MAEARSDHRPELSTQRIEALSDGIFAFSMTLLVLNLNLPEAARNLADGGLHGLLWGQMDKFINYAMSFFLLAAFWLIHNQQFHHIKRTNKYHLWINIVALLFVTLVPFSTSLVNDYSREWMAEIFFDLNMFVLGMLFFANWFYATKDFKLVDNTMEKEHIILGVRRSLVIPLAALLAIAIFPFFFSWSGLAYLSIFLMLRLPWFNRI